MTDAPIKSSAFMIAMELFNRLNKIYRRLKRPAFRRHYQAYELYATPRSDGGSCAIWVHIYLSGIVEVVSTSYKIFNKISFNMTDPDFFEHIEAAYTKWVNDCGIKLSHLKG